MLPCIIIVHTDILLYLMVIYRLGDEVRPESLCTMMFAYDTVICSESREQVEASLER